MRALIQRVKHAVVNVDQRVTGAIEHGFLVFIGVEDADTVEDVAWIAGKLCRLRLFGDDSQKMNLDIRDIGGGLLIVSQFTLHASTKKGNRPGFSRAASPVHARKLYDLLVSQCRELLPEQTVETGEFGAMMEVALVNDGPVTIWMDSKQPE
jgi:D-aminoacyl-tRNA deacylase